MTTVAQAVQAILAHFVAQWNPLDAAFTIDGEPYTPDDSAPYVRISIRHDGRRQRTLGGPGNRRFDSFGSVFVQCFAPSGSGALASRALASTARGILEARTLSGVFLHSGTIRELGVSGAWYQTNVEVAFDYEETK